MYRQLQSKSKVLVDKARSKGFWHELVQDGMDEESKNQRDNSKTPEWWEKIDIKRKEKKYGKRVDMLQRLGCRLLRTSSFLEVLCFLQLIRYQDSNATKHLKDAVKMRQTEQLKSANTPNPPDSSTLLEVEEVGDEVPPWEDHTPHGEASTLKALSGPKRSISPNGRSEARMRAIFPEGRGSGSSPLKGCSLLLRERQWLLGRSFPGIIRVWGNITFGGCGLGTSNGVLNDLSLFCHPVHFHGDKRCSLGVEPRGWGGRGHVPALHTVASLSILHTGHHMGRSAPLEVRVIKCRVLGGFHVGRVSREELIYIIGGVMNLRGSTTTSSTLVSPAGTGAASGPVVKKTSASILVRGHRVVHGPALG